MKEYAVRSNAEPEMTYYVSGLCPTMAIQEAERLAGHSLADPLVFEWPPRPLDPDLVLGFARLERGEVAPSATCPQCGQEFDDAGIYVGFCAGAGRPEPFGPVCAACATTE